MSQLPMADRHETVLPPMTEEVREALQSAVATTPEERRDAVARVVAAHPSSPDAWAELAAATSDDVERYAYARVGYHRGLDALRAHGWGGRGYVRWAQESNRGFLTCVAVLRDAAGAIGEEGEVARLTDFLHDLDPDWDDAVVAG